MNSLTERDFIKALDKLMSGNNAIADLSNLLEEKIFVSIIHYFLAFNYYKEGQIEIAQKEYSLATSLNPNLDFSPDFQNIPLIIKELYKNFLDYPTPFINTDVEKYINNSTKTLEDFIKALYVYFINNDLNNALNICLRGLQKYPNDTVLNYNKSAILMKASRYQEAWPLYENRISLLPQHKLKFENIPKMTPSDLLQKNKNILVFPSAGFGDTIMYSRFLKYFQTTELNIFVQVQPALKSLYQENGIVVRNDIDVDEIDYQISFMSLGWIFNANLEQIFEEEAYIKPNITKLKKINEKYSQIKKLKIGIVWKAGDSSKNLPLQELINNLQASDLQLFSLQKEIDSNERLLLNDNDVVNLGESFNDFSDTAAAIASMDIVIGCDTALINLSCAMNKKTFVVVPYLCDFRWQTIESSTAWYPSAIIYRQRENENLSYVVTRVADIIKNDSLQVVGQH